MRNTFALWPLRTSVIRSPTLMQPDATVPARPRKSRPSRSTVCTGKRKVPRGVMSRGGARAAHRAVWGVVTGRVALQVCEQMRARVPVHVLGPAGDVVAADRGNGNGDRL